MNRLDTRLTVAEYCAAWLRSCCCLQQGPRLRARDVAHPIGQDPACFGDDPPGVIGYDKCPTVSARPGVNAIYTGPVRIDAPLIRAVRRPEDPHERGLPRGKRDAAI